MAPQIGYLLPTRERVMEGRPETAPLLDLAARAERLGFHSVWVGDSLLARPRHDPLTLLAAIAVPARVLANHSRCSAVPKKLTAPVPSPCMAKAKSASPS